MTDKHLTVQERSDKWLLEQLARGDAPTPANVAVSALRIVSKQLKNMAFLPTGHARRHIEDRASTWSARTCFAALKYLDPEAPNRVIEGTENDR